MTKEVNVFHLGKQPRDFDDQIFEVNLIERLTSEHEEEPECKSELVLIYLNKSPVFTIAHLSLTCVYISCMLILFISLCA